MFGDQRSCPFCGAKIFLSRCQVVATDQLPPAVYAPSPADASSGVDVGERLILRSLLTVDDPSAPAPDDVVADPARVRARPTSAANAWPESTVLWSPPPSPVRAPEPAKRGSLLGSLRDLQEQHARRERDAFPSPEPLQRFPAHRIPRRACTSCARRLPVDLDDREAHLLAVVGINAAGKTHLLATALTEATRRLGLRPAGITEFSADTETAERLQVTYYNPIYRRNERFPFTPLNDRVVDEPLTFRVTVDGFAPMLVVTHDLAGEGLVSARSRATVMPFLRRASAVVFVVDPLEFDAVRARVPRESLPVDRSLHQADLLEALLRELDHRPDGRPVPVALTVSKSDMLDGFGDEARFPADRPSPGTPAEWVREIVATSGRVQAALRALGEHELVERALAHGPVTFHAVSALGVEPRAGAPVVPMPRRVLDPFGTVLIRLCHALASDA